jgi:hypothetical protein
MRQTIQRIQLLGEDIRGLLRLPRVEVNLMIDRARDNDPFFERMAREFYREARRRHRKFPLVAAMELGVALCPLTGNMEEYLKLIESSARRNCKKAERLGYRFDKINFNDHLHEIRSIRQSTDTRQGKLPDDFLNGPVAECKNPPSRNPTHDYPYFGILKDGHLYAYAGCMVAGELCMLEHIYGHAAHQENGIVPLMLVGIAQHVMKHHPTVRYYGYGTFFGATPTMRRFKKKFHFLPHRVTWRLE